MKTFKGKVSIIMPAYNEGGHLYKNIKETIGVFNDIGCQYEIVVVNDGSTDNTLEEAKRAASDFNNIIVKSHRENYGKGRTIKMGTRFAKGDLVLFLDADLDLHPAQIQVLFDIMKLKDADVVIGSKRHPDSIVDYPWHRKIVSSVYFFLVKLMFGLPVRDTQTGIKLFKREVVKKVFPRILVKSYAYDLEALALAHHFGYKVTEAPITLNFQREFGRIGFSAVFYTWWDTMAVFYRMFILKYYDKVKFSKF